MSIAIVKSPALVSARVALFEREVFNSALVAVDSDKDLLTEEIRARLQLEFDAKLSTEKERAYADGFAKGMNDGHAEGVAMGQESFQLHIQKLQTVIDEVQGMAKAQTEANETFAAQLAFEALVMMVGSSFADPTFVSGMVNQVAGRLREVDVVQVRMHPKECEALRRAIRVDGSASGVCSRLVDKLVDDDALNAGGVVVETARGTYSAPLDVQLAKLHAMLLAVRRQPAEVPQPELRNVRAA